MSLFSRSLPLGSDRLESMGKNFSEYIHRSVKSLRPLYCRGKSITATVTMRKLVDNTNWYISSRKESRTTTHFSLISKREVSTLTVVSSFFLHHSANWIFFSTRIFFSKCKKMFSSFENSLFLEKRNLLHDFFFLLFEPFSFLPFSSFITEYLG